MRILYYLEINITCIIILAILLITMLKTGNNKRDILYRGILISGIAFCLCDLFAGVFRGTTYPFSRVLLWISNIGYFISSFALSEIWVIYGMYVLTGKINKKIAYLVRISFVLISLFFITTPFTGLLFTLSNENLYTRGPFLWTECIFIFPCLIIPSLVAPFTKADKREKYAITVFGICPIITMVIQIFIYGITICQVGITSATLMVFVMYQSILANEALSKAQILNEISFTDVMTNLQNRRSYENKLSEVVNEPWVGSIFADLNGLKRENDTNGHKAGDLMICNFADLLKEFYELNNIFRISGDEFVVITTDKENFNDHYKKLIPLAGDIASVGISEGIGSEIVAVIRNAEKEMYKHKEEFYNRTGLNRRN